MMETQKQTAEQAFRSGLEDAITICKTLAAHCQTVEELIGMLELAVVNDAQMRLLIVQVKGLKR